jgi:hypothetical protein
MQTQAPLAGLQHASGKYDVSFRREQDPLQVAMRRDWREKP